MSLNDWPGVTELGTSSIDTPAEAALPLDEEAPLLDPLDDEAPPLLLLDEAPLDDAPLLLPLPPVPPLLEQPLNIRPAAISDAAAMRDSAADLISLFMTLPPSALRIIKTTLTAWSSSMATGESAVL